MKTALVLGAGGFIGSHMVKRLKSKGYWVRGVDLKYPEFSESMADQFVYYDLRNADYVKAIMRLDVSNDIILEYSYNKQPFSESNVFDEIYQFAADMGGCQYVFTGEHDADIMHNSALINLNVLEQATKEKIFYSSSACIYPKGLQDDFYNKGLSESDAYPANPDSDYGWEKLFSERLYLAFNKNKGIDIRIARLHNIYGPEGTYQGGREKAPASITMKVINKNAKIWGDGLQTRSFLYIDDCIDAVRLLMHSDYKEPINIGSDKNISILDLWKLIIDISDRNLQIKHIERPGSFLGVRNRNSDNTLIREVLNWKPKTDLKEGMNKLYQWIKEKEKQS